MTRKTLTKMAENWQDDEIEKLLGKEWTCRKVYYDGYCNSESCSECIQVDPEIVIIH